MTLLYFVVSVYSQALDPGRMVGALPQETQREEEEDISARRCEKIDIKRRMNDEYGASRRNSNSVLLVLHTKKQMVSIRSQGRNNRTRSYLALRTQDS